jgi:hypothetical protein
MMSRQIDITQPLSDEDRKYLEDRCEWSKLAQNEALLKGHEFVEAVVAADPLEQDTLEQATATPPEEDVVDPETVDDAPRPARKK